LRCFGDAIGSPLPVTGFTTYELSKCGWKTDAKKTKGIKPFSVQKEHWQFAF
jgi:hypothetical protein